MYFRLVEEGPAVRLTLSRAQIEAVERASREWQHTLGLQSPPLEMSLFEGFVDLRARGTAGFISIGALSLEIIPKYIGLDPSTPQSRSALWRLLQFANPHIEPTEEASGDYENEGGGIADLLAWMFLESARTAPLQGLPMQYVEYEATAQTMQGRLDKSRLVELVPFRGYIPLLVDRLTADIPANQLLRWTARQLEAEVLAPLLRLALHKFQADIPAEIVGKVPATLGAIRVDTQHAYLRPALEIGVMLATDRSAAYGEGTLQLPGFLWKSSDLFESAVRRLFRQASRRTGVRVVKRAESLLMRGNKVATRTTPDLQFIDGVDVQLVLDSKYKVLAGAPLASDCYQVIAAGRRLRVHTVGLIYPVVGYGLDVEVLTVPGDGLPRRLAVMRLGLSAFRSGEHVDRLRRDVRRWLSSELSPAQDRILATA